MEKKENKQNKKNEQEEKSTEQKKREKNVKKEVVIHSMPKRFLKFEPIAHQSKGLGILILALGALVLAGLIFAMYFFVFKKDDSTVAIDNSSNQAEEDANQKDDEQAKNDLDGKKENNDGSSNKEGGGDNNLDDNNNASSSVDQSEIKNDGIDENEATSSVRRIEFNEDYEISDEGESLQLLNAEDSDNDGLFDSEEEILGTNKLEIDSDGDGYDDFSELFNMYNPAGKGEISDNDGIEKYSNSLHNYSLYYPAKWEVDKIDGENSIIFKAENNQFVQIMVQENAKNQSLEAWYKEQFNISRIDQALNLYKRDWLAVRSEDGLNTYLQNSKSDKIFIMTYSIGLDSVLYYKNIYSFMIKSLELDK